MTEKEVVIIIRKIKESDREEYIKMAEEFYSSDAVSHTIPKENFENAFEDALNGNVFIELYILEYEGVTAGYAAIALTYTTEGGGKTAWLDELYIKEQFRGKGLGRSVIKLLQKDVSIKRVRLEIMPDNERAKALYKSEGFQECKYRQMILDKK
ncbi:MAG: GNAT family N-acetyltransferase [Ruminococcaceae bacterium]|nr:GNAT family N-acetyltransferase [Oscillospiraceae bacterium]